MNILAGEYGIEQILEGISLDDEDVEEAARTLPKFFLEASKYHVRNLRKKLSADSAHEVAKATADLRIRRTAHKEDEKVTEAEVKARIIIDPEVRAASKAKDNTAAAEKLSSLLLEAFRLKKSAISAVVDLKGAEVAAQRGYTLEQASGKLDAVRQKAKKRWGQVNDDEKDEPDE